MRPSDKFLILIVDDDTSLVEVLNHASQFGFPEATYIQVTNSADAKTYIKNLHGYGPKLVLLDINLGEQVDGLDFLVFLRDYPQTHALPVIMLTVSELPAHIERAYSIGASSFTNKPNNFEEWVSYLSRLRIFWFETATLPSILFYKANE
ncbi:response regulator [Spirosoma areae]